MDSWLLTLGKKAKKYNTEIQFSLLSFRHAYIFEFLELSLSSFVGFEVLKLTTKVVCAQNAP